MFAKLAIVVVAATLGLTVVTPTFFSGVKQIDSGVTLRVQGAGISNEVAPSHAGNLAVARARTLATEGAPLVHDSHIGEYPADYTGLIGYAWQLPHTAELSDKQEWARALRENYAVEIPPQLLQAGDVLANDRSGDFGHALLFAQWSNPAQWSVQDLANRAQWHTRFEQGVSFIAYEVDRFNYPARVQQRQYTLKWAQGAMTILELERDLRGPYDALRSNQIAGYVEMLAPVSVKFTHSAHTVTTHFSILNRGGAPVVLENIAVIAYGPDALHQGIAGTQTPFPQVKRIVLQPGQIYEYEQTRTVSQPGTYLALASFQSNGQAQMPLQPVYFQITAQ
jgi:hypothetical protein